MTDKEIILKIVNNCLIDVSSLNFKEKDLLYNNLLILTDTKRFIDESLLREVYFLFSEISTYYNKNMGISQLRKSVYQSFFEKQYDFNNELILLLPKDFNFLWNFYHNNENTKESLEKLMKQIDFNERVLDKKKLLKQLHELNIE